MPCLTSPSPVLKVVEPLQFCDCIRLEGVHFRYGHDQPEVLNNLDFEIRRGERIGLIGTTGSGKSTAVDLLMGLLEPTVGKVTVDGLDLYDPAHPGRLNAWRTQIAHVPKPFTWLILQLLRTLPLAFLLKRLT